MCMPWKGLHSTRAKKKKRRSRGEIGKEKVETAHQFHIIPEEEEKHEGMNNIVCYAALIDKQNRTL